MLAQERDACPCAGAGKKLRGVRAGAALAKKVLERAGARQSVTGGEAARASGSGAVR